MSAWAFYDRNAVGIFAAGILLTLVGVVIAGWCLDRGRLVVESVDAGSWGAEADAGPLGDADAGAP